MSNENEIQAKFLLTVCAFFVALGLMVFNGWMIHVAVDENKAAIEEIRKRDNHVLEAIQKRLAHIDAKLWSGTNAPTQ
jgi:hypothetical protein